MKLVIASMFFALCSFSFAEDFVQPAELREQCKIAQEAEKKEYALENEVSEIIKDERMSAPVTANIYNILTSCFTLLFSIQRFHEVLALNQENNRNDFIRAAIVIKNFSGYFQSVSGLLARYRTDRISLKEKREKLEKEIQVQKNLRAATNKKIKELTESLGEKRSENSIRNDVVYHIAGKSESIEELDAELEAENTVGVLRNSKISTELKIEYPVAGKIVHEFGDKDVDEKMIYYLGFETMPGAIVTSPVKGLIVFAGKFLNYDNMVIISNGEYRLFLYGIEKLFAETGDAVEIGDYIGRMAERSIDNPEIKVELKKSGEPLDPRHWIMTTLEEEKKI